MHEWALAESVITTVLEAAEKKHLETITEIIIDIGELQQIEQELFSFAVNDIMRTYSPKLTHTKITVNIQPSTMQCKHCGHTWTFDDIKQKLQADEAEAIHFLPEVAVAHSRCPHCNSPDFEIQAGRGVTIRSIKGTKQ
ncbi:MAG: hydrogenase nickel incorporation protein HypA [Candidatus Thermoplasmatota archaeon]|nr:hydrogenase nickel incorporation protein HypA [Candidatus Thermoplasmatota archaeon]